MIQFEQKYLSLLTEAERRELPDVDGIRLCFQILSLASAIDRDCATQLKPHGLSEGRFVLLFLLDSAPAGVPPYVLADQAGVRRATVTGLLDGLERDGFVERVSSPHDRRSRLIQLTHHGKTIAQQLFVQHSLWIASLLGDVSEQERRTLSKLLAKVAARTMQRTSSSMGEEEDA